MSANERVNVTKVAKAADDTGRPAYLKVVAFAIVGFAIGITWPWLSGIHIGPQLPGEKNAKTASSARPKLAASRAAVPNVPAARVEKLATKTPARSNKQRVVVGEGRVERCYDKKKKLDPGQCGRLKVNRVLVPPLEQLASCPAALGLHGELRIGFELRFGKRKPELRVLGGKAKELPRSTVAGIVRCVADFMRDVSLEKVAHKYLRYRVYYTLNFYPPGAEIESEPTEGEAEDPENSASRGLATVVWDSALVRDEPRVGKVVSRLVRGTRVKILGRRKDWYRVRVRGKDGWVYRSALGR
jgi:hypothetical protein